MTVLKEIIHQFPIVEYGPMKYWACHQFKQKYCRIIAPIIRDTEYFWTTP